jgi:hypothetical protein
LSGDELAAVGKLQKHSDVVFCKPDKSNGVVILDKTQYDAKMLSILNDPKKFKQLHEDPTEKREASLQRYLRVCITVVFYQLKPTTKFDHVALIHQEFMDFHLELVVILTTWQNF